MQCNTKRCSHAGSPRWVKDAECKCNAMQSNVIISPIMHLKVVPNWSAMALNGTKLAPTWCQNDPIRVYSDANPCLQLHESVFTSPVGAEMDQRPPKQTPRWRQTCPSWSQVGRKWAQDGPSWVHFGSKFAKFNPKLIQGGFKWIPKLHEGRLLKTYTKSNEKQ